MLTSNVIVQGIETIIKEKHCDYIDACIMFSEKTAIDIESIAEIVKREPALRMKLFADAQSLNLLTGRGARLPV